MKPIDLEGYKLKKANSNFITDRTSVETNPPSLLQKTAELTESPTTTPTATPTPTKTTTSQKVQILQKVPKTPTKQPGPYEYSKPTNPPLSDKKKKTMEILSTLCISYICFDFVFSIMNYRKSPVLFKKVFKKMTINTVSISLLLSVGVGIIFHYFFFMKNNI
tara:strand:- start:425 stop:913 length:489 start_codon:yes stop_codon:yes gene_type:complete